MASDMTSTGRAVASWQPRVTEFAYELVRFAGILALTLLGLIFITFIIGRVVPIDPVLAIVGDRALPETYARARQELGIDLPIYQQFWIYLLKVVQGDFGTSAMTSRPVLYDLAQFFPATLELATAATLIGVVVGIPLGVVAATHHGRWIDHVTRVVGLVGYSIPIFWMGLVGLLVLYAWLGLVAGPGRLDIGYDGLVEPVTGLITIDSAMSGDWDVFANALSHLVLPASLLGYLTLAYVSRMTRSFMLAQLSQEYILTARAKGMPERRVIWRHALGNIVVPLITVVALSYASLLEGAVLTETVFAWPGLGLYITRSLFNADMNAVLGGTMLIGAIFVCLNVFCDLLYRLLDPRART
ncbi:ABC transporter permease [Mesorhizobium sp. NZP2298]|uniref:ABC transporter permease n=1 Tax=Mesorhizobium sp. NZP2298 TaxID=2483403 RepID=UPI001FEE64B7|nr:ABC transporter permease [Mesorhizobium sp. NZP2298]